MNKVNNNSGFTLLETIVAVAVLTTGILTIVTLLTEALQATERAKNASIASSLAQEGVEVVHNIRTTNWLEGDEYDAGLDPGDYCVDHDSVALQSCSNFSLFWNGTAYTHTAADADTTPFERQISIRDKNNPEDSGTSTIVQVRSVVSWDDRTITVEDHLYDWK